MYSTLEVQKRLKELGINPGPIDGIRGRKTISAVKEFQRKQKITVDGIVGPVTLSRLFPDKKEEVKKNNIAVDDMPWLDLAYRKKGLHEVRDNSALRAFLRIGGTVGDPAKIPWCGDFVETCIASTLPDEPIPTNPYLALNWTKFGKAVKPQKGAILVFWRGSPSSWQGHVGFYVGEDRTHYHVLGGNQSNAVTVSRIAKNRLREEGCRWPSTALDGDGKANISSGKGLDTTTNEA